MSQEGQTTIDRSRYGAATIASAALAAAGIATAIYFRYDADHWAAALTGWTVGWVFTLVAIASWQVGRERPILGRENREQPRWRSPEILAMVLILAVATALRVVAIESFPIQLHNDEMSCLLEARPFLAQGEELFNTGWFDCPRLGFFLTSIPMHIFGPTLFALRLSSALLGVVSPLAAYLLVRRLFGVRPAMLLLLFTAPFHWHLHYSRAGFHYMQAGALTVVALWLFVTAVDRPQPAALRGRRHHRRNRVPDLLRSLAAPRHPGRLVGCAVAFGPRRGFGRPSRARRHRRPVRGHDGAPPRPLCHET